MKSDRMRRAKLGISKRWMLYRSDYRKALRRFPDNSVDAVITDPPYDDTLNVRELRRVCKGNIVVFCKPENQFFVPDEYLFWVKTPSTKNYLRKCGRFVEMILVKRRGRTFNALHWSQMTGVYDDRLVMPPTHPHEKPISLVERLLRIYTNHGDRVLDPFMGSGVVGVACVALGRHFIGVECDPDYFKIARHRIENVMVKTKGACDAAHCKV